MTKHDTTPHYLNVTASEAFAYKLHSKTGLKKILQSKMSYSEMVQNKKKQKYD